MVHDVVIVGGGPAGMMVGLLFARAGIATLVLEKHGDFLRDFRGDTVHPSTMEILDQLRMLGRFLERPHNRIDRAEGRFFGHPIKIADLSHLPVAAPFIAMMPQWDFLDFLADEATAFPTFALRRNADVVDYVERDGRVAGVRLADGEEVMARRLVIAADGRRSIVRRVLPVEDLGSSIDVLWFRVPRDPTTDSGLRGFIDPGRMLVCIDRSDYWQCAYIVAKDGADAVYARGIAAFRNDVETTAPDLGALAEVLTNFDQVKLLSVALDRLTTWSKPGLLAIGDAAHSMSPIGGIGINLAIQDAVATANVLATSLAAGNDVDDLLARVQRRRMFPTRVIQGGQRLAQNRLIGRVLAASAPIDLPWPLKLLNRFALLRRIPGRMIGLGIRRERVRLPNV